MEKLTKRDRKEIARRERKEAVEAAYSRNEKFFGQNVRPHPPGAVIVQRDGKRWYQVQPNGEWRRVQVA
jgi:hypothetical protein